jgi:hypothetical protein
MTRASDATGCAIVALLVVASSVPAVIPDPVRLESGSVAGVTSPSGVRVYRGIPFAAPPIGRSAGGCRSPWRNGRESGKPTGSAMSAYPAKLDLYDRLYKRQK